MPQGLSAHPLTAYQARPGGRPTQRRLAACLRTHKRMSKRAPGAVLPLGRKVATVGSDAAQRVFWRSTTTNFDALEGLLERDMRGLAPASAPTRSPRHSMGATPPATPRRLRTPTPRPIGARVPYPKARFRRSERYRAAASGAVCAGSNPAGGAGRSIFFEHTDDRLPRCLQACDLRKLEGSPDLAPHARPELRF